MYYIWVPWVLVQQAIVFMIPHYIWKLSNRNLIKEFGTPVAKSALIMAGNKGDIIDTVVWNTQYFFIQNSDEEKKDKVIQLFITYFKSIQGSNKIYLASIILCEILNLVVLITNFNILDVFFSYKWKTYGFDVLTKTVFT